MSHHYQDGERERRYTRRPRSEDPPRKGDGLPYQGPLLITDVEERLEHCGIQLEEMAIHHEQICIQAASDKADWEKHLSVHVVRVADSGEKTAADVREARARLAPVEGDPDQTGNDLYRAYKINTAAAESGARAMKALETRGGWLQTLAANIRGATN